jgi:hypothetical protein
MFWPASGIAAVAASDLVAQQAACEPADDRAAVAAGRRSGRGLLGDVLAGAFLARHLHHLVLGLDAAHPRVVGEALGMDAGRQGGEQQGGGKGGTVHGDSLVRCASRLRGTS